MITDIISPTKEHLGSFACEYQGSGSNEIAKKVLLEDMSQMVERRGYGKIKKLNFSCITKKKVMKNRKGYMCKPKYFLVKSILLKLRFSKTDSPCYILWLVN